MDIDKRLRWEIKGSVEQDEQSSIMAENVLVEFDALEYKPVEIPDAIMNLHCVIIILTDLLQALDKNFESTDNK